MKLDGIPRPSAGQVMLFAPAAILAFSALLAARNVCARPVVRAEDSPHGGREAVIFLEYPPAYPFTGGVRAVLEVRRLPGHSKVFAQILGEHRWAGAAVDEYRDLRWPEQDKIVLASADGSRTLSVRIVEEGDRPPGGKGF